MVTSTVNTSRDIYAPTRDTTPSKHLVMLRQLVVLLGIVVAAWAKGSKPEVAACRAAEFWPESAESRLFTRMDAGPPACKAVAQDYACGYAYAKTLGMDETNYACLYACAPHMRECKLEQKCLPTDVATCYARLNAFVRDAFGL